MVMKAEGQAAVAAVTFLTSADVARRAGVTPEMVRVWNRRGQLPAQRTEGGVRLFRSDDVARLLEVRAARRIGGAAPEKG
jgi:DNA-binding transcriptional MerR regulator